MSLILIGSQLAKAKKKTKNKKQKTKKQKNKKKNIFLCPRHKMYRVEAVGFGLVIIIFMIV